MLSKNKINTKKAMSIIEVMIAIFIFTLGLSSVLMLVSSAGNMNTYNKDSIIASNLAKEQIELIRNIRDTNYKEFQKWNILDPKSGNYNTVFKEGSFYKIENDFSKNTKFHIKSSTGSIIDNFEELLKNNPTNEGKENYRICINDEKEYIYCDSDTGTNLKKTPFYKYIEIQKIKDKEGKDIENSFRINSKVYWNSRGIHKIEIPTILADYKRL